MTFLNQEHRFRSSPKTQNRKRDCFAAVIHGYLQEVNRHYQVRREAHAFGPPDVVPLPYGTFYAWLKKTKKAISGQSKVPRMSEERQVADGVLALAGNIG